MSVLLDSETTARLSAEQLGTARAPRQQLVNDLTKKVLGIMSIAPNVKGKTRPLRFPSASAGMAKVDNSFRLGLELRGGNQEKSARVLLLAGHLCWQPRIKELFTVQNNEMHIAAVAASLLIHAQKLRYGPSTFAWIPHAGGACNCICSIS